MSEEKFNIFRILEKDDKELIHSSFISFLLTENDTFYKSFLGIKNIKFSKPFLEKTYSIPVDENNKKSNYFIDNQTVKKKQKFERMRIDIEVNSLDKKNILVIENKFKTFPTEKQLNSYNKLYEYKHKQKKALKYLICFDKSLIEFQTNWKVLDYNDLLKFIKKKYLDNDNDNSVKSIFIRHYYIFLNEYYTKYNSLKSDCKALFVKSCDNENRFWLKLIYSALQLQLAEYFKKKIVDVRFNLNPGSTSVPLLEIIPKKWKIDGKIVLIQFQGNELKYYTHSDDKNFVKTQVDIAKEKFKNRNYEFKKLTNHNSKSNYIFKTKLSNIMVSENKFHLENIMNSITSFYEEIESNMLITAAVKSA